MGFSLKKFTKSLTDDISSGSKWSFKKADKGFDSFKDIIDSPSGYLRPAVKYGGQAALTLNPVTMPYMGLYNGYRLGKFATEQLGIKDDIKKQFDGKIASPYRNTMDFGIGSIGQLLGDYEYNPDTQKVEGNYSLKNIPKFFSQKEQKERRYLFATDEERASGKWKNNDLRDVFRMQTRIGKNFREDPDVNPGVKFGLDLAYDPTNAIGVGGVGRLGSMGLKHVDEAGRGAKLIKTVLGHTDEEGKAIGATSRTARIAGGLTEGFGKRTIPAAVAGGGAMYLADKTSTPWDDTVAGFVSPMIGAGAGSLAENKFKARQNVIRDSQGDVFMDITTHLENNPRMPDVARGKDWKEKFLPALGISKQNMVNNDLDTLLNERGLEKVTKQEILDRIKENDFDIEEVHLTQPTNTRSTAPIDGSAMYENYTIPGGIPGSYREIIIKQKSNLHDGVDIYAWQEHNVQNTYNWPLQNPGQQYTHNYWTAPGGWYIEENNGQFDLIMPNMKIMKFDTVDKAMDYAATHKDSKTSNNQWNEQGDVLMHIRVHDEDGGRTLVMNELQSDWAQEIRSGKDTHVTHFNPPIPSERIELNKAIKAADKIKNENSDVIQKYKNSLPLNEDEMKIIYQWESIKAEIARLNKILENIPDKWPHPFQDNWQNVGIKRILRYAAEQGYDRVKFASGEETLRIPGMELEKGSKEEAGRLNSYNKSIPDIVSGLAKRFGYTVQSDIKDGDLYLKSDVTIRELDETIENQLKNGFDYDLAIIRNLINDYTTHGNVDINSTIDVLFNKAAEVKSSKPVLDKLAKIVGLEKEISTSREFNTVVTLTPESRASILSGPQVAGMVSDDDARMFDDRIAELRKRAMAGDDSAYDEINKLNQQRSQMMASKEGPSISRGARMDELSDDQLREQWKMIQVNDVTDMRQNGIADRAIIDLSDRFYREYGRPLGKDFSKIDEYLQKLSEWRKNNPEASKLFNSETERINLQNESAYNNIMSEMLRRGSPDIEFTTMPLGDKYVLEPIIYNPDHNMEISDISPALKNISIEEIKKYLVYIEADKSYRIKQNKEAIQWFRNKVIEAVNQYNAEYGEGDFRHITDYFNQVDVRRSAEGGRGVFGEYNNLTGKKGKKGFVSNALDIIENSLRKNRNYSTASDPNAAKRAERMARWNSVTSGEQNVNTGQTPPDLGQMTRGSEPPINEIPPVEPTGMPEAQFANPEYPRGAFGDIMTQGRTVEEINALRQNPRTVINPPYQAQTKASDYPYFEPRYGVESTRSGLTLRDQLTRAIWGPDSTPSIANAKEARKNMEPTGTAVPTFSKEGRRPDTRVDLTPKGDKMFMKPKPPTAKGFKNQAKQMLEYLEKNNPELLDRPVGDEEAYKLITDMRNKKMQEVEAYLTLGRQAPEDKLDETGMRAFDSGLPNAANQVKKHIDEMTDDEISAAKDEISNRIDSGGPRPQDQDSIQVSTPEEQKKAKWLGSPRALSELVNEVKVAGGKLGWVRAAAAHFGVNPSVLMKSDVGRLVVAKTRQDAAIEELASMAVAPLDKYAAKVTGREAVGRFGTIFKIGEDGKVEGIGWHFNDIASAPDRFPLTPRQRAYIDDFNQLITDVSMLREQNGLDPLPREINGELYVPRKISGYKGIEITKPTNNKADRLWELATQGAENGVDYADPRETARLYVYDAYREIVDKQFADEMAKITDPSSRMASNKIKDNFENALSKRDELKEKLDLVKAQRKSDPKNQDINKIFSELRKELADANKKLKFYRKEYRDNLAAARSLGVDFNKPENAYTYTVKGLGERVVTKEDAEYLRNFLGIAGFVPKREESHILARGANVAGRTLRTTASTIDLATHLIHGLPMLANNPVGWSKAVAREFNAFMNPQSVAKYMEDNADIINEMRAYNVPVGSNEFFEGSKILSHKLRGHRVLHAVEAQTLGRFEAGMDAFLMTSRVELWKANREKFLKKAGINSWEMNKPGEISPNVGKEGHGLFGLGHSAGDQDPLAGLAQYVRNMTGALDARSLMVGKSQRDLESLLLAFSPKLFRSTIALAMMAANPTTIEGRAALRSLAVLGGATAVMVYGLNKLSGRSDEEALASIDPRKGREFMSVKLGDGYYGVGGQFRALTQLIGRSIEAGRTDNWGAFKSTDQFENPLLGFYTGRGAPAYTIGQDFVEGTFGVNANPYEEVNGFMSIKDFEHSFIGQTGKNYLPFALQNLLEGENAKQLAFEFAGGRYTPYSRAEQTDGRVATIGFTTLDGKPVTKTSQMNKEQKKKFYEMYPVEHVNKEDNITKMFNLIDDEEQKFQSEIMNMSMLVDTGKMTREQFRNWYNTRNAEKYDRISGIKSTFNVMPADRAGFTGSVTDYVNSKNTTPEDRAVNAYYEISSTTPLKDDGTIDFDGIAARRQRLLESLPPAQRAYVERQTNKASQTPANKLVTEYDMVKELTKSYWESTDAVFEAFKQESGFLAQFNNREKYDQWIAETASQSGLTPDTLTAYLEKKIPDIKYLNQVTSDYKKRMRLINPQLDRALTDWYGMEPANRMDYMLSQFGSDEGAQFASNYAQGNGPARALVAETGLKLSASGLKPMNKHTFYRPQRSLQ